MNVPNAYQSGYSNNTSGNKQGPYPSSGGNQGYGNSAYSNNQVIMISHSHRSIYDGKSN